MGNGQTKILTGTLGNIHIGYNWSEKFNSIPSIIVTPICKNGEQFIVKITDIYVYGFRFQCLKLNGEQLEEYVDDFQWIAISVS